MSENRAGDKVADRPGGYVLFGQVQETKRRHYEEHRRGLNFVEAVRQLKVEGQVHFGEPDIPDFLSWNLLNMREFRSLIYQVPVYVEDVLADRAQLRDGVLRFHTGPRVQITLESCYSAEELLAVDAFSVLYVLEGECRLQLLRERRVMRAGEVCILLPQTPHYVFTGPENLVFQISSAKSHFRENFRQLLCYDNLVTAFFRRALLEQREGHRYFMLAPTKDIRSLIQHLFAEYVKKDTYSNTFFNNYLQIFYGNIIRSIDSTYRYYSDQGRTSARILVPAMLDYIGKHYQTVSLAELAREFHYEPHYLCRVIRRETGRTLVDMITEQRNREAARLLEETELSVERVAEQAGYQSADYFQYCFKRQTGLAPSVYRKKCRAEEIPGVRQTER